MSRKLNVQELESRIAPSTGLATFLSNLAKSDSQMAALVSQYVNANGQVDVNGAASAWNARRDPLERCSRMPDASATPAPEASLISR